MGFGIEGVGAECDRSVPFGAVLRETEDQGEERQRDQHEDHREPVALVCHHHDEAEQGHRNARFGVDTPSGSQKEQCPGNATDDDQRSCGR